MLPLPLVAPRDSHELWFGSSRPRRSSPSSSSLSHQPGVHNPESARRQSHHHHQNHAPRTLASSTTPSDSLAALLYEERALRIRKENIASFGCAWIKPAGCPKTMLGMREEDAEREEGLAAAAQEMNAAAAAAAAAGGGGAGAGVTDLADVDAFGDATTQQGMGQLGEEGQGGEELERDLDDDIPEADEGLVEEGEEGYEDDEDPDEGLMERNLDDDIPDGLSAEDHDSEDDEDDDFDNQPDLDNDIPAADDDGAGYGGIMVRDLDEDVPEAGDDDDDDEEDEDMDEGEWQHTDSEDEDDGDGDDDDDDDTNDPFAEHFRTATNNTTAITPQPTNSARRHRGILPLPPQHPQHPPTTRPRETEAQRRFLQRWSGGGHDAFDSSMLTDEDDLRASITSQDSVRRQSRFGRFARRGGPRDSLD